VYVTTQTLHAKRYRVQ